jgi:ACR3 family arsenite efflux pump ArsB
LVIIFAFQGDKILQSPFNIALIAVPLIIQTFLIFFIAYGWAYKWKLPHNIAAPAAMIGASNFFELAVAVAIVLFGLNSGATLVTVVGVLVEVPCNVGLGKDSQARLAPSWDLLDEPFGSTVVVININTPCVVFCTPLSAQFINRM